MFALAGEHATVGAPRTLVVTEQGFAVFPAVFIHMEVLCFSLTAACRLISFHRFQIIFSCFKDSVGKKEAV